MNLEFTAKTAMGLVDNYNNLLHEKSKEEFDKVIATIATLAKIGKQIWTCSYQLSDPVTKNLKLRGFIVDCQYEQRNGYYTTVTWN